MITARIATWALVFNDTFYLDFLKELLILIKANFS